MTVEMRIVIDEVRIASGLDAERIGGRRSIVVDDKDFLHLRGRQRSKRDGVSIELGYKVRKQIYIPFLR